MRGLKGPSALMGAGWAWRRYRRGSDRSGPVSVARWSVELLSWGAAGAALGGGASVPSEHRRARRMRGGFVLVTGVDEVHGPIEAAPDTELTPTG